MPSYSYAPSYSYSSYYPGTAIPAVATYPSNSCPNCPNGSCSSCPNGCLRLVPQRIRAVPAGQMAAARMDAAARARREPANRGTVRPIARTANARRVATTISAVRKMIRFRRGTRGPIIPRRPRDIRRRTGRTHRLLAAATIRVRPTGTTETATTNWRARSTTNAT